MYDSDGSTYPAPRARHPPHELSSVASSIHSKPILNQSARLFKLALRAAVDSGVISSIDAGGTGHATDPPGHRNEE